MRRPSESLFRSEKFTAALGLS